MADDNTQTGVVIDKNKTAEQYIKDVENLFIVPHLVRDKFPDLVKLIYETESMNKEEREYWLQIMPIMTEEQIVKFRNILVNEKEELSRLDREYDDEVLKIKGKPAKALDEKKRKETIEGIKKAESSHEKSESAEEDALLNELENL